MLIFRLIFNKVFHKGHKALLATDGTDFAVDPYLLSRRAHTFRADASGHYISPKYKSRGIPKTYGYKNPAKKNHSLYTCKVI
jgi:hypothetical protein